ncbi:FAD-dependent oxidoreductase [Pseudalkalibacillus hwajinpoensis]|uniref:NAD(P)/FAD-dependent oxidoreductase n=1 Tax=Guptibacillus hwajinpoensis TaxID=208199 RepID=UPI00325A550C
MKAKLMVVGNGEAATRFLESLLSIQAKGFEITVVGKEPQPAYKRHLLTRILQGEVAMEDAVFQDSDWYKSSGIRYYSNESVLTIDTDRSQVKTDRGRKVRYDHLVIATGSSPYLLPIQGAGKKGVKTYRTLEDCRELIQTSETYKKAAVIGAGLLGLEVAMGLVHLGLETTVVHHQPNVMNRQLDRLASEMLQEALAANGLNFALSKRTREITGDSHVKGIRFSDGSMMEADLVLMSVGIRPNVELAKKAGLEVHRGIVIDDDLCTSVPNVYAIGECAEHRDVLYGTIGPIYEQAEHLARKLCDLPARYTGSMVSTHLNIRSINVFSTGQVLETEETRTFQWIDPIRHIYKKVVTLHGHVIGAILYGDTSDALRLTQLVKEFAPVNEIPSNTLFPNVSRDRHNLKLVSKKFLSSGAGQP